MLLGLMMKGWHQQAIGISQVLTRWLEVLADMQDNQT